MSGLFGSPPPPPVAAAAPPLPDPTSPSVIEAQNASTAAAMQRQGRASTVLGKQGGSAPVAADSYSGSKLGNN